MLSIIIPTYNERENIGALIRRLEKLDFSIPFEIIIVDDNSPDGTWRIAEEIGRIYGNVIVIRRHENMGISSAIGDGVKIAKGDIIAVMDADLQHPRKF